MAKAVSNCSWAAFVCSVAVDRHRVITLQGLLAQGLHLVQGDFLLIDPLLRQADIRSGACGRILGTLAAEPLPRRPLSGLRLLCHGVPVRGEPSLLQRPFQPCGLLESFEALFLQPNFVIQFL